ncbi:unnamed protein product [Cyclocybe aegerita]|uniref:Uncharacterized protein n=1 Tax=Cyclocybe aegerita TaxID=1973307 RepID=A0A8S0WLS8_CYCAE|nr:unnamed protein product [Cyclocybe aegerita]
MDDKSYSTSISAGNGEGWLCQTASHSLLDLPDSALRRILRVFATVSQPATNITLVNKRLRMLALPYILHTITISSQDAFNRLAHGPYSPLCYQPFAKHVRSLEVRYDPIQSGHLCPNIRLECRNVKTVSFRFTAGACLKDTRLEETRRALFEDTLCRASKRSINASWLDLFLQLNPRRFEWKTRRSSELHLVGMYGTWNQLFNGWTNLSYAFLDGICLVDQADPICFSISLPAQRVHIRNGRSNWMALLHYGPSILTNTGPCQQLLLNNKDRPRKREVPAVVLGSTVVSLKGWSRADRRNFRVQMTEAYLLALFPPPVSQGKSNRPGIGGSFKTWFFYWMDLLVICLILGFSFFIPRFFADCLKVLTLTSDLSLYQADIWTIMSTFKHQIQW